MIFDTWGGVLTPRDYQEFSLAYMRATCTGLTREADGRKVPVILFTKGGPQWLELMADTGCDALGLDWTCDIGKARTRVGDRVATAGNMDPSCCTPPRTASAPRSRPSSPVTARAAVMFFKPRPRHPHRHHPDHVLALGRERTRAEAGPITPDDRSGVAGTRLRCRGGRRVRFGYAWQATIRTPPTARGAHDQIHAMHPPQAAAVGSRVPPLLDRYKEAWVELGRLSKATRMATSLGLEIDHNTPCSSPAGRRSRSTVCWRSGGAAGEQVNQCLQDPAIKAKVVSMRQLQTSSST